MQFIGNDLVTGSWDTTIMVITIPVTYCRHIAFGLSVCNWPATIRESVCDNN